MLLSLPLGALSLRVQLLRPQDQNCLLILMTLKIKKIVSKMSCSSILCNRNNVVVYMLK